MESLLSLMAKGILFNNNIAMQPSLRVETRNRMSEGDDSISKTNVYRRKVL